VIWYSATLDVAFLGLLAKAEEVEVIGIFQQLLCQLGLRRGQGAREVGQGPALAPVQIALDLMNQHRAALAVLNRLASVPHLKRIPHDLL
jgi:hypothetical protein